MRYCICDIIISREPSENGEPAVYMVHWAEKTARPLLPLVEIAAAAFDDKANGWKAADHLVRYNSMQDFTKFIVNYPAVVGRCTII